MVYLILNEFDASGVRTDSPLARAYSKQKQALKNVKTKNDTVKKALSLRAKAQQQMIKRNARARLRNQNLSPEDKARIRQQTSDRVIGVKAATIQKKVTSSSGVDIQKQKAKQRIDLERQKQMTKIKKATKPTIKSLDKET